jgi:NAD kinase
MTPIRRCALVTRFADARAADSAAALARHLAGRGIEVLVPEEEAARLGEVAARFVPEATLAGAADLMVAIGGDGTLLYAAGLVAGLGVPSMPRWPATAPAMNGRCSPPRSARPPAAPPAGSR